MSNVRLAGPALSPRSTVDRAAISYVDWSAILAGVALAAAISTLMTTFGAAVGLSAASAFERGGVSFAVGVAAALWLLWVGVSSFVAGGYLAGRMRHPIGDATPHEREIRDSAHGLVVWAIGSIMIVYLATSSMIGVAGAIGGAPALSQKALGAADPTMLVSDRLWRRPGAADAAQVVPEATRQDAARILAAGAVSGTVDAEDRAYLASQVAARTGLNAQDAGKRVDDAAAQAAAIVDKAKQAAESARKAGVVVAFLTAATLAICAAAAWWGATMGGKHRDDGLDLSHFTAWR